MIQLYLFAFCRIVVGLVFLAAFVSKVRNIPQSQRAIGNFQILPRWLSVPAAFLFLGGELAVMICMAAGNWLLLPGFVFALLLLLLFSLALASVLVRKLSTSCNCFGSDEKPVSPADIWRNVGFLCCALGGVGALIWIPNIQASLSRLEWLLTGIAAAVFVLIWTRLSEITHLFRTS